MARKKTGLAFALAEHGTSVRAVLEIDGTRILTFENEEAPSVSVRHPRANEKKLLETALYWARRNPANGGAAANLDFYVTTREGDVAEQITEIRKALRRIAGSMRNASIARKLKKGFRK